MNNISFGQAPRTQWANLTLPVKAGIWIIYKYMIILNMNKSLHAETAWLGYVETARNKRSSCHMNCLCRRRHERLNSTLVFTISVTLQHCIKYCSEMS